MNYIDQLNHIIVQLERIATALEASVTKKTVTHHLHIESRGTWPVTLDKVTAGGAQ